MKDCKNSTVGSAADSGTLDECQGFSSSVDKGVAIGSMEFVCYGRGVSGVQSTAIAESTAGGFATAATSSPSYTNGEGTGDDGDNGDDGDDDEDEHHSSSGCCQCECCCCCVVM